MKNTTNIPLTKSSLLFETEKDQDMKLYENMIVKNHENLKNQNLQLKKYKCFYIAEKISKWQGASPESILVDLADGRTNTSTVENTARSLYGLKDPRNKNDIIDGYIEFDTKFINRINIGVKTLSKSGLDLMQSGFKGRGFKGIPKHLKYAALFSSIQLCDYHIIVDSNDPPILYYSPVSSKDLISKFVIRNLPLVLSRKEFYKEFYNIEIQDLPNDESYNYFEVGVDSFDDSRDLTNDELNTDLAKEEEKTV